MNSCSYGRLIAVTILVACCSQDAGAQPRDADRVNRELEEARSRISDQRVSRQAEVMRLEQMIERLQERVTRLERQSMGPNYFPVISVLEAKAAFDFAEAQLKESEQRLQEGTATEAQVAGDRLAVVRARAQVDIAKAAQIDRTFSLELDVTHAERRLAEAKTKQERLEQLVAKGYGSVTGLQALELEVDQAQKELLRARTRLEFQQQVMGAKESTRRDADE